MKIILFSALFIIATVAAVAGGRIDGTVRIAEGKEIARGAKVTIASKKRVAYTTDRGTFTIKNLDAGTYDVAIHSVGQRDTTVTGVVVKDGETTSIDVTLATDAELMDEIVVYSASKRLEKVTETPSAVTAMTPIQIERAARGNQLGRALEGMNGVDIVQNGSTDFNVNTRGFNNSTNRRLLVLVDGRDVALQQIGATEWNSFAMPLDEFASIELVRGPAAALYGANAFNGVLNMRTLSPRESQGTKITLLAGDYENFRGDVRHAGMLGDDWSYKITLGHSQSYNLAQNRTDSASMVAEYPSLWPAARELNTITSEDRQTFATYGTVRVDYDLQPDQVITGEFGYTEFGNEIMLAGAGRIHVPHSNKPYARLAYNDPKFHVQALYNARNTLDTMRILAAPPGTIILDESYDLNLDAQYSNDINTEWHYTVGAQYQYLNVGSLRTVFPNDPIKASIGGVYGQLEFRPSQQLNFALSARYDNATIYPQQFSPRLAVVYTPVEDHTFRVTAGRSFQRANFSELYRKYGFRPAFTAQGRPVNFRPVQATVNDTLSALVGAPVSVDLGLYDPTITNPMDPRAIQPGSIGVGNEDLKVEENIGLEFGYRGRLAKRFTFTIDLYYNRMTNFISGFLPGVNENYESWTSGTVLPDSLKAYQGLVDSLVYGALQEPDRARFTTYSGDAQFVVSNTNFGLVDQWGAEIALEYHPIDELTLTANYNYYGFELVDVKTSNPFLPTGSALLSPNTSPHRVNIGAAYAQPGGLDVAILWRWVDGFPWLAGDFRGEVLEYNVMNFNAGYHVTEAVHVGVAVNNVFDFKHYEIYGGSIIPRLFYVSASYNF
jgi:iron complex outermembrane receptor protein